MGQTPLLSIVAAVYNGEKFLAQFFECIEQLGKLDSYELILVNDGSTDKQQPGGDRRMAGRRLQNVQVLEQENPGRLGRAAISASPPPAANMPLFRISTTYQTLSGHVSHAAGDGRERTSRYRYLQRHLCVRKAPREPPDLPTGSPALDGCAAGPCLA